MKRTSGRINILMTGAMPHVWVAAHPVLPAGLLL
jgi:hypothetical protein